MGKTWIPREQIRSLTVDSEEVWIYETIELQVIRRGQPPVRVPWVAWVPMFKVSSPRPGARGLTWSQQRIVDRLAIALNLEHEGTW